jgi:riboflavin synthase alpha subunit
MFTGLIEATGRVERLDGSGAGRRLVVSVPFASELRPGDSVAVDGVCLTVVDSQDGRISADLSPETLHATSFGAASVGRLVNLERPVRAASPMGGHFVLGHVDATARVGVLRPDGGSHWLEVEIPATLEPYVVPKGSIAINGISLTVASLERGRVGAQIVPFTFAHTSLRESQPGDIVNVEADVLGKYVARLLAVGRPEAAFAVPLERQPL